MSPPRNIPTVEERRLFGLDPRRRREDLAIRRMRDTTQEHVFGEICRRLIRGESVVSVSTWIYHLRPQGCLHGLSWATIRSGYVQPLQLRLREQVRNRAEKIRSTPPLQPIQPPSPPPPEVLPAVIAAVEETIRNVQSQTTHPTDELRLMVDEKVAQVQGLEMLHYLFFEQDRRFRAALELERSGNGLLRSEVTHLADVMRRIAEGVCKVELSQNLVSAKKNLGINPPGVDTDAPSPPKQADEVIRRFESLSPIDRNLLREAGVKYIEILREEVGAGFKASGLGSADAPNKHEAPETPKDRSS
jgi:hypothetical protein